MLKITGTVHEIMPIEEIGNKGFAKRTLVVCDDPTAEYPSYAAFEAKRSQKKDRTLLLDQFRRGETVEVTFVPDAREWKDPRTGKTRWFGSLVLIDIERVGNRVASDAAQDADRVASDAARDAGGSQEDDVPDDFPF